MSNKVSILKYHICDKCGKNHLGSYGNVCSRCVHPSLKKTKTTCLHCDKTHKNIHNDNLCYVCHGTETKRKRILERDPNIKRCSSCHYILRSNKPFTDKCSRCLGGRTAYYRSCRQHIEDIDNQV